MDPRNSVLKGLHYITRLDPISTHAESMVKICLVIGGKIYIKWLRLLSVLRFIGMLAFKFY